ncbi:hypothetical protein [Methanoplanus limicola]|nr:hypothetical protein [Methanoplanus limicola]
MAEIEHDLGIRSSYYFRHPYTFKPDIISKIHELGHEVGYHYETLSKARGEPKVAIKLFEEELNEFKKIHEIKTICMHGKPLSGYDNRELWKYYDFHDYGIEGEAYLSIDEQKIQYFTDTGRNWSNKNSLRDFMSVPQTYSVETTDDLINLIKSAEESYLYLNIHPERWTKNYFNWISSYLQDNLINAGKTIIAAIQQ